MSRSSPWGITPVINNRFLDIMVKRTIPTSDLDRTITLDMKYEHSPSLLAYDLYGHSQYWWVIPQRNNLVDPIFSLKAGIELIVPDQSIVKGL